MDPGPSEDKNQNARHVVMRENVAHVEKEFRNMYTKFFSKMCSCTTEEDAQQATELLERMNTILKHPRHEKMTFVENESIERYSHYRVNNKVMGGLTETLKNTFFNSKGDIQKANKKQEGKNDFVEKPRKKTKKKISSLCKKGGSGHEHGKIVHRELEKLINLFHSKEPGKNMLNIFRSISNDPDDDDYLDGCTLEILNFLVRANLYPLASELNTYHEELEIATEIDLVCLCTRTGKIAFVEIKTGRKTYNDFYNPPSPPKFRGQISDLNDTPCMRACLQLLICLIIWKQKYGVVPYMAFVLFVSSSEKRVYPIYLDEYFVGKDSEKSKKIAEQNRAKVFKDFSTQRSIELNERKLGSTKYRKSSSSLRAEHAFDEKKE